MSKWVLPATTIAWALGTGAVLWVTTPSDKESRYIDWGSMIVAPAAKDTLQRQAWRVPRGCYEIGGFIIC